MFPNPAKLLSVLPISLISLINFECERKKRNEGLFPSLSSFQVHMGMQFSEDEVDEMIREVDVDGITLKFGFTLRKNLPCLYLQNFNRLT